MNIKNIKTITENYPLYCKGGTSSIYTMNNNILLKIFNTYKDVFFEQRLEKLSKLNTNYIALPIENIYIKGKLIGYSMVKKDGITFNNIDFNTNIEDILISLLKLEEDLIILSENNIRILDLHTENILYDNNKYEINIIDTDEYGTLYMYKDLYNANLKSISSLLFNYLNLSEYIPNDLYNIKVLTVYIRSILNYLAEINKKEITRVGDLKLLIKR